MYESEIAASAARTSTGNSSEIDTLRTSDKRGEGDMRISLDVTAASGTTPSMTLTVHGIYTRSDGTKIYVLLDTFGAKTGVSQESRVITSCPRNIRVTWTISGTTPSLTFSVHANRT